MEYCVVFVWASKWHNPCESSCRVRLCVSLQSQRFNQKTELKVRLMATWVCLKMGYTRQIPIHMLIRKMTVKHGPDDRNLLLPCCCFRGVKLSPLSSYDLSFLRPLNRKLMQRVDHGLCLLPHWLPPAGTIWSVAASLGTKRKRRRRFDVKQAGQSVINGYTFKLLDITYIVAIHSQISGI